MDSRRRSRTACRVRGAPCHMGRRLSKAKPMMGGEPQPMQFGPAGPLKGQTDVPGDKYIYHRVLMLSAMAVGRSRVEGLLPGRSVAPRVGQQGVSKCRLGG